MRNLKHFLALASIIAIALLLTNYIEQCDPPRFLVIALIPSALIILQLALRSQLFMKELFTSKFNILTSKYSMTKSYAISSDLLFEKVMEELKNQGFQSIKSNPTKGQIFVQASITFKSWGENLYFTIEETGGNTSNLLLESVAFQFYSWGKNEDNARKFFSQMEESLII